MNPFGSGRVVVRDGFVTDDGDFYTQNAQPCPWRWLVIRSATGTVFGTDPPRRLSKAQPPPSCFLNRTQLSRLPLAGFLVPGDYTIRLWGATDADPEWYEIGSGNPADNGATDVRIETTFRIGAVPPPVDPIRLLREGVEQLEGSQAYLNGFANVVKGTRRCRQALDALGSQP